jgi:hypothetical protein
MKTTIRTFFYALILTGLTVIVSLLIALYGFHHLFYLGQMLPLFMGFYILLAWLLYLRRDAFMHAAGRRGKTMPALGHQENELARDLPEDKISGAELYEALKDQHIIPRSDQPDGHQPDRFTESSMYTLFWSACLLAATATVLYHYFGIGARYY